MQEKGAIVIGGHINGLGIIRSLAAFGIPVAVILTKRHDLARHSCYISGYEKALKLTEHPDQLLEALERGGREWKRWALFPTNDEGMAAIAQNRSQLESGYPILAPPNDIIECLLDKERMRQLAQDIGMAVPVCYGSATPDAAERPDLRFPVVVKPTRSYRFLERFGCKVFHAADRAELLQAVSAVERAGIACQIYDIIPGPDSRIYCYCVYMDSHGNPKAELTVRKIRQSPPFFGVARVAEITAPQAHLREATVEFLRRIRFRGIASAEFKLDPRDGTFRFLEINGRSVIYNSLLRRAGMDLARLVWSDYSDGRVDAVPTRQWPGVWINLHADLLYSALHGRRENLLFKDFLAPYRRPKIEAVWSVSDPKPFLIEWGRTLRKSLHGSWRNR